MSEKLRAGREMDAEVARQVFGCEPRRLEWDGLPDDFVCDCGDWVHNERQWGLLQPYSTEIGAAWQVVEHLRRDGWIVCVREMPDGLPFLAGAGWNDAEGQEIPARACCILYDNPVRQRVKPGRFGRCPAQHPRSAPVRLRDLAGLVVPAGAGGGAAGGGGAGDGAAG